MATPLPGFLRVQSDGLLLAVKLQPRASATAVGEPQGDELRVKVTAPPVDSAANEALLRLLADALDCGRNRIELVRGGTSRHKLIKLHGFQAEEVLRKLSPLQNPRTIRTHTRVGGGSSVPRRRGALPRR